jgi:hypothetical protein
VTDDECWIYWHNHHRRQYTTDRAVVSPRIRATISSKKILISASFTHQGFVSIEAIFETERLNSAFFTETILLSHIQFLNPFRPKMQAQSQSPYIGDVCFHNCPPSFHKTEELGFTILPQPPCFPDLTFVTSSYSIV